MSERAEHDIADPESLIGSTLDNGRIAKQVNEACQTPDADLFEMVVDYMERPEAQLRIETPTASLSHPAHKSAAQIRSMQSELTRLSAALTRAESEIAEAVEAAYREGWRSNASTMYQASYLKRREDTEWFKSRARSTITSRALEALTNGGK